MKKYFLLMVGVCVMSGVFGQVQDTTIYAQGKIYNHSTKEAVNAKISYQSLPYGNIVGELSGTDYLIPLYGNEKYSITVVAPGFAPSKYLLDPGAANGERKVIQDIELGLPSAASVVAPTTHHIGKVMRLMR